MSFPWARSCQYGQQWSRSPINPCYCSWRNVWQLVHQSCNLTARSTPSLAIKGMIQILVHLFQLCCYYLRVKAVFSLFSSCLLESMRGNSIFLPRYHSSAVILYLQAFKFPLGEAVSLTVDAKGIFSAQQFSVFMLLRCTFIATWLHGIPMISVKARKPAIM